MATEAAAIMNCRPLVNSFSHNMLNHVFSTFSLDAQEQNKYAQGIEEMKKKVKIMLGAATTLDKNSIILIDTIERLGLAYHFETEIEEKLQQIHDVGDDDIKDDDLFIVALRFRILRQHQYHVSCGVFEKFTDKDKKFLKSVSNDVEGLLSLYEAANVQIGGEEILDEGLAFAVYNLKRMFEELESSTQHKVNQALEQPLHKGMPIVQSRHYISIYEQDHKRDELLLKFAKFNFNYLQNLYKNELSQLLRWWKEFELESKLPFARDRVTEIYFWSMAFRFEPHYSDVRLAITKCMQMQTIMDDTYDNYATVKEADLFTRILERWDMDEIDQLPDYF